MKKNRILYIAALLIILKTLFQKRIGLNGLNTLTILYYILLGVFSIVFFKNYEPKNKSFWLLLIVYIVIVIVVSLYPLFF